VTIRFVKRVDDEDNVERVLVGTEREMRALHGALTLLLGEIAKVDAAERDVEVDGELFVARVVVARGESSGNEGGSES